MDKLTDEQLKRIILRLLKTMTLAEIAEKTEKSEEWLIQKLNEKSTNNIGG